MEFLGGNIEKLSQIYVKYDLRKSKIVIASTTGFFRHYDADQTEFGASLLLRSSAHWVPYVNFMFLVVKPPLFPCFNSIRVLRVFISLLYYVYGYGGIYVIF
jgi:hypothetical protein